MTSAVTHPLVSAYLRDLEMLLRGIDPGERAEVLAGVHEHLDASLPPSASDDEVRRALAELGSPQSVADEAYAGRSPQPTPAPTRPLPSAWPALAATVINAAGMGLTLLLSIFGGAMGPHPAEILFGFGLLFLPWVAVCVLSAASQTWSSRDKATSILLLPAFQIALAAVVGIMMWLVGPSFLHLFPTLVLGSGAVWSLVRLARAATAPLAKGDTV